MSDGDYESAELLSSGVADVVSPDVEAAVIYQELIQILVEDVQFGPGHPAQSVEAQNDVLTGSDRHIVKKDLGDHLGKFTAAGQLDTVAAGFAVHSDAHLDLILRHVAHDEKSGCGMDGGPDADAK